MRMDRLTPLLDSTATPRVVTWEQALAIGFTPAAVRHQLRIGRWTRILPRVYLTSDVLTWPDRLDAALAYAGDGALLSGAAALVEDGLRCVDRPSKVLVLTPAFSESVAWVRVRNPAHAATRRLMPGAARVTTARAIVDLGVELRWLDDVRALVAEAVRRSMCSVVELMEELRHAPRRGSAHLRTAIDEMAGGAWSAPEASTATLLRTNGIRGFEQNARIDLHNGRRVYVDFLWRDQRAVLEIDSIEHHFSPGDIDDTMSRHIALETAGFSVVHRSPLAIRRDPLGFVADIQAWLASR